MAAIGYHAVLAAIQAARAGSEGHWGDAAERIAVAAVAAALVIGALVNALRIRRR